MHRIACRYDASDATGFPSSASSCNPEAACTHGTRASNHDTIRTQSERNQNAISTQSECNQYAIRMQSVRNQGAIMTQSGRNQRTCRHETLASVLMAL